MPSATVQRAIVLAPSRRARFARDIGRICGASNVRVLWAPAAGDVLTSADLSPNKRVITHSASIANRMTPQGAGQLVTFNGTSQNASIPDADDLSFGNGTVDSPHSMAILCNPTDTAADRQLVAKYNSGGGGGEYRWSINASDGLQLIFRDQSAAVDASRSSNSPISQGAPHLFGYTYSAATGGATAGNDIALYQDGVVVPSTASNNAGYVAMENLTTPLEIGARTNNGGVWFPGSIGMVLLCATALTAGQMLAIKQVVNAFYGLAL